MISYTDLYEILRKEKYSETMQPLPKNFLIEVALFIQEMRDQATQEENSFMDGNVKSKKQLENSIALFKELILRRKKKILNLAFVATETGIMKRDFETMMNFERGLFEKFIKAFEDSDKELSSTLHGKKETNGGPSHKMILFTHAVEQFVDMSGKTVGPYGVGSLANIDSEVAAVLVSGGKASYVDEE